MKLIWTVMFVFLADESLNYLKEGLKSYLIKFVLKGVSNSG